MVGNVPNPTGLRSDMWLCLSLVRVKVQNCLPFLWPSFGEWVACRLVGWNIYITVIFLDLSYISLPIVPHHHSEINASVPSSSSSLKWYHVTRICLPLLTGSLLNLVGLFHRIVLILTKFMVHIWAIIDDRSWNFWVKNSEFSRYIGQAGRSDSVGSSLPLDGDPLVKDSHLNQQPVQQLIQQQVNKIVKI